MSIEPLRFSGVSSYSADFQKILERTVAIASQPITQLQGEQAKILEQRTLAGGLLTGVDALNNAVKALGETGQSRALAGSSSNSAKVSIGAVTARTPATYTISEITSMARIASATSAGMADASTTAISSTGSVRLTFKGTEYNIPLDSESNHLTGLRDAINDLGMGLTASILTTGSGETPYYLSLSANTSGENPITLVDDPAGAATNLLATVDNGSNANFKVNGAPVSKSSNLINDVVSGVTFSITGTTEGTETVGLTLSSSRSTLSSKLQSFVSAYNAVLAQTDAQIGEAAGLLTGSFLVRETNNVLRELSGYEGSGTMKSLAGLGVKFGSDGKATFDTAVFDALSDAALQSGFEFLGSPTTGFGSMQSRIQQISAPVTGLIAVEDVKWAESDKRIQTRIEELYVRLDAMQKSAAERLQSVDAMIGSLESQQVIIEASYKSLQMVLFGKNEG